MSQSPENYFECTIQTRWSDQDLNGHVNNAKVLTLAEEARVQASNAWSGAAPDGSQPRVVRSMNIVFDRAIHYGKNVQARVWVSRIGNTSFRLCHELLQEGQRCAFVESVLVLMDPSTNRPTPLTEQQRAELESALVASDS
ncbi:acyl-CoA thioesterase [Nesterenkonia muleiensis]|uniref:acyl-CoA thioesterase n=1 Tax=Nesterenkonia muleiensis TaxID=2282648 RepID=UPI000E73CF2F|nr:thioesterase family protein [Nesterenkonia muleiensis]